MSSFRRLSVRALALCVWGTASALGFLCLLQYERTPGSSRAAPQHWPEGSSLQRSPGKATLVLAVHPRCPCSRATVAELEQLMTRCQGLVVTHVLFYRPQDEEPGWEHTDMWERTSAIPGVRIQADLAAQEAQRFGALTSGHALLYGAEGQLLFSGGITDGRGHAGESVGRRAILAWLTQQQAEQTSTPVFGCPLCQPDQP